jgi:hypothetical protein
MWSVSKDCSGVKDASMGTVWVDMGRVAPLLYSMKDDRYIDSSGNNAAEENHQR